MFNIIITGKLENKEFMSQMLEKLFFLKKKKLVDQIIISTWENDIKKIDAKNINIIFNKNIPFSKSFDHQIFTLHQGLKKIENKKRIIIKMRTDLLFSIKDIINLSKLNFKINNKKKIIKHKIWIPYFEITQPFYIADEVFATSYENFKKIVSKKNYYNQIKFDTGYTHILWFAHLFFNKFQLINYSKFLAKTFHFKFNRFLVLNQRLHNQCYLSFLKYYYLTIKNYFIVGSSKQNSFRLKKNTINFHLRNNKIPIFNQSLFEAFKSENSAMKYAGHIFCRSQKILKRLINTKEIKKINNLSLKCTKEDSITINDAFFYKSSFILEAYHIIKHFYHYIIFKLLI